MTTSTVTFLREDSAIAEIDAIAKAMDRPRSYIINQALDNYSAFNKQQLAKIDRGIADAQAGRFVSEDQWQDTLSCDYLK